MKTNLSPENHIKLFTSLTRQYKVNHAAITTALEELNIKRLTDENFETVYQQVENRLFEDTPESDIPCIDCRKPFEIIAGASNVRCKRCNQIYLSKLGGKNDWHTWVFGKEQNPSQNARH